MSDAPSTQASDATLEWRIGAEMSRRFGSLVAAAVAISLADTAFFAVYPREIDNLPDLLQWAIMLGPFALVLLTAVVGFWRGRRWVRVGTDGFSLRTSDGDRFVSYADVHQIDAQAAQRENEVFVRVALAKAEVLIFPFALRHSRNGIELAHALRDSLAKYRTRTRAEPAAGLPTTASSLRAWLEAKKRRGPSFRQGTLDRDALLAIAEDPAAVGLARAGAAAALREGLAPRERTRLRAAAQTTAAARVRVVLDSVAQDGDDDAALTDALAQLERER